MDARRSWPLATALCCASRWPPARAEITRRPGAAVDRAGGQLSQAAATTPTAPGRDHAGFVGRRDGPVHAGPAERRRHRPTTNASSKRWRYLRTIAADADLRRLAANHGLLRGRAEEGSVAHPPERQVARSNPDHQRPRTAAAGPIRRRPAADTATRRTRSSRSWPSTKPSGWACRSIAKTWLRASKYWTTCRTSMARGVTSTERRAPAA